MFYAQLPLPSVLSQILLCSDGLHLTGLYFTDQKDCPALDGLQPQRPESRTPAWGTRGGMPIKKFKAYKNADSGLFEPEPGVGEQFVTAGADLPDLQSMQDQMSSETRALFNRVREQLCEYLAGRRHAFDIPLRLNGTSFQKKIWEALLRIPHGEVVSYADVARMAGLPAGYGRAVGTAVGRNPITIIVPCHRVLSSSRSLTGYTGGLERKIALLELEGFVLR